VEEVDLNVSERLFSSLLPRSDVLDLLKADRPRLTCSSAQFAFLTSSGNVWRALTLLL